MKRMLQRIRDFPLFDDSEFSVRPWYVRWAWYLLKSNNLKKSYKWQRDLGYANGYKDGQKAAWEEWSKARMSLWPVPEQERHTDPTLIQAWPLPTGEWSRRWHASLPDQETRRVPTIGKGGDHANH